MKKNSAFTFICSFLPGAAEMYMGFMKMGVSLMALFFLSIFIPSYLRIEDIFICFAALIWFYGFFHARNLVHYEEERLRQLEDHYIWEEFTDGAAFPIPSHSVRKWGAAILIVCGIALLWRNLMGVIYALIPERLFEKLCPVVDSVNERVPRVVIAVLLIVIGVRLIMGKKEEIDQQKTLNGDALELIAEKKEEADGEGK
ncbi:MAG: hypothetical protein IJ711_01545 [Lachnospiraceae bacterium]|nr:hypothetical protein [Lachnospiraceae bacterium]